MNYLNHPLIKKNKIENRIYQMDIVSKCINTNSLIILPTSLGKTIIAILIAVNCIEKKLGKVLILAPTKPLVIQHINSFSEFLIIEKINMSSLTGLIESNKRKILFENSEIIISTPEVIKNDLIKKKIDFKDIKYIIFDEAHRAVGSYAYTYIANKYYECKKENGYMIGITASPGSNIVKIENIISILKIKKIIKKNEQDSDVKKYIHPIIIEKKIIELPGSMNQIKILLSNLKKNYIELLNSYNIYNKKISINFNSKKNLLLLKNTILGKTYNEEVDNN